MDAHGSGTGRAGAVPPGWPAQVRPPGAAGWERTATAWLLDLCPPDHRGYPLLVRHPAVLAWVTGHHVEASARGARDAVAAARADLRDVVDPPTVEALVEVLEQERARLMAAGRAVRLVAAALRGERYVPRL